MIDFLLFIFQAAIGSIPLDTARARGFTGKFQELLGIQIVTIAVLVILITAPIGAVRCYRSSRT